MDAGAISALDFTYGNWDRANDKFFPNKIPVNMVQVTAGRTAARGNALSTFLMGFIGRDTLDGFNDIYAEAYGNIEYGSNEILAGCPNGLVSDFTGSPEKPIGQYLNFALVR